MCTRRVRRFFSRGGRVDAVHTFDEAFEELQSAEETYGVLDRKYENNWRDLTENVKRCSAEGQPKSVLISMLRRRLLLGKRREQLLFQKDQLFQKRLRLEQMSLTASHASGLKAVLGVCREMAKGLDCDDVEEMMEEMSDITEAANETQLVLNEEELHDIDEEKLELELREIQCCKHESSLLISRPTQSEVPAGPSPRRSLLAIASAPKAPQNKLLVKPRRLPMHVSV